MPLLDVLRLTCGLFLLPHFLLKVPRLGLLHQFYERARLPLPRLLAPIGFGAEGLVVAALLSNHYVFYGAALGVAFMLAAAFATVRLNGSGKWRWEKGGPEYPLFIAVLLMVIARYSYAA